MAILIHIVGEIENRDENDVGAGKPEDQLDECHNGFISTIRWDIVLSREALQEKTTIAPFYQLKKLKNHIHMKPLGIYSERSSIVFKCVWGGGALCFNQSLCTVHIYILYLVKPSSRVDFPPAIAWVLCIVGHHGHYISRL